MQPTPLGGQRGIGQLDESDGVALEVVEEGDEVSAEFDDGFEDLVVLTHQINCYLFKVLVLLVLIKGDGLLLAKYQLQLFDEFKLRKHLVEALLHIILSLSLQIRLLQLIILPTIPMLVLFKIEAAVSAPGIPILKSVKIHTYLYHDILQMVGTLIIEALIHFEYISLAEIYTESLGKANYFVGAPRHTLHE